VGTLGLLAFSKSKKETQMKKKRIRYFYEEVVRSRSPALVLDLSELLNDKQRILAGHDP
jgi:hypothetical protein